VLVKAERKKLAEAAPAGHGGRSFRGFRVAKAGLTRKEAHAIFHKVEFWQVRSGDVREQKK